MQLVRHPVSASGDGCRGSDVDTLAPVLAGAVAIDPVTAPTPFRSGSARVSPGEGKVRARPHGLPRDRVAEVQRARLLAAAAEVVSEFGYAGMSMVRVTSRAGVSRKTFYDLFADREDCFLALFDGAVARIGVVAIAGYEREGCWREQVRAGLLSVLEFAEDEPMLAALVVVDALGAGPRVLARRARVLETLTRVVEEGRSEVKAGAGPPPMTAEGVVGAVLSVLHARLLDRDGDPLVELLNPLMAMIVLPYLGQAAATRELAHPLPKTRHVSSRPVRFPLDALKMRVTYRTVQVLATIAELSGGETAGRPSNREIAEAASVHDQGQISKLLSRLQKHGLIENTGLGQAKGEPNAWGLTTKGDEVQRAIQAQAGG
jgi:AcrR family transcriptional regulator